MQNLIIVKFMSSTSILMEVKWREDLKQLRCVACGFTIVSSHLHLYLSFLSFFRKQPIFLCDSLTNLNSPKILFNLQVELLLLSLFTSAVIRQIGGEIHAPFPQVPTNQPAFALSNPTDHTLFPLLSRRRRRSKIAAEIFHPKLCQI